EGNVYCVKGCLLWSMPYNDLEVNVRNEWEKYKRVIKYGVKFTKCIDRNGKITFKNNLPNKSETKIIHIRPHAQKAAYKFNNGEIYGNVERNANMLPSGEYMTTQSFWLNNDYILNQIKPIINKRG
ncbi:MAG: restriction endonuclease, partial [Clostridia bacterium]|nr:restriction endonuclease [Clostridia bacterium]